MSQVVTREDFEDDKKWRIENPKDPQRNIAARIFMEEAVRTKYFYNFTWLGVPIIQFPQDLIALQEIIYDTQPDIIIETGLAWGGSALFYGSCLNNLPQDRIRTVYSIEKRFMDGVTEEVLKKAQAFFGVKIRMIQGSSIDPSVLDFIVQSLPGKRVMVCLDSAHSTEHVRKEVEIFSKLVTPGCYMVVFDTFVRNMPSDLYEGHSCNPLDSPRQAVDEFLAANSDFEIDHQIDGKLIISSNPRGFLRRKE